MEPLEGMSPIGVEGDRRDASFHASPDRQTVPRGNTYAKYASTSVLERRFMANFFTRLNQALPVAPPRRVLEVGIGEGEVAQRVAQRYPDASVIGLDLPDDILAQEWLNRDLTSIFGDITRLPFPDKSFDLVLAIEVLEHVPHPDLALAELSRVAARDVVVSVPREPLWRIANMARGKYWAALGNTPGHIQHWSSRGFRRFVAEHLEVTEHHSPTPWTMLAARVRS
jgi:SAM-dependent methyltransferase